MDYEAFRIHWNEKLIPVEGVRFECGHCGSDSGVTKILSGSIQERRSNQPTGRHTSILFCPVCSQPSYRDDKGKLFPATPLGAHLKNLPVGIAGLYLEARASSGVGAYTACVMVCRKILMNLAVLEKADENLSFVAYVDYLAANGFVPPKGKAWVNRIRDKGNEANHEIKEMTRDDATEIVKLVEMLLRFNFELGEVPPQPSPKPKSG